MCRLRKVPAPRVPSVVFRNRRDEPSIEKTDGLVRARGVLRVWQRRADAAPSTPRATKDDRTNLARDLAVAASTTAPSSLSRCTNISFVVRRLAYADSCAPALGRDHPNCDCQRDGGNPQREVPKVPQPGYHVSDEECGGAADTGPADDEHEETAEEQAESGRPVWVRSDEGGKCSQCGSGNKRSDD